MVCLVAIGVGGFLYFTKLELREKSREPAQASNAAPASSAVGYFGRASGHTGTAAAAVAPPRCVARASDRRAVFGRAGAVRSPIGPARVLANEYVAAAEPKALALNRTA